jgi:hypothetical protein
MDRPVPVIFRHQSHWLATQGLTQVDPSSVPLDLSVGPDPSHRHTRLVLRRDHPPGIRTFRRLVTPGWRLLPQGFMRAFLVVSGTKSVKSPLLLLPRGLGRLCSLRLKRSVEPLQPSVLLRMTRLDALRNDSRLDPPHRQSRQSTQANTGEGRTVVGPDRPGQAVLSKGSFQNRAHLGASGLAQPVTHQEIPGGGVSQRQGIDPYPIPGAEPTLEVDAPQVVGLLYLGKGLAPRGRTAARLTPAHQSSPVQQVPNGAGGGPSLPRRTRFPVIQPGYQLLGTPGWVVLAGQNQPFYHRPPRTVRMHVGCAAKVAQSLPAPGSEALNSFVAGLRTNSKGLAQIHEGLSPCFPSLDEPSLLRFRARTTPRHHFPPHRCYDCVLCVLGKCYLCPRFKCYQSTRFVPHPNLPPQGGKELVLAPFSGQS